MTAAEYREFGQVITVAPDDAFPGHANVNDARGKRSAGTRTRMAKRVRWLDETG
jgi:hypothetical protein